MEQELVNALQSLRQAFETNVRDCEEWVQYRNAVAALRHAAQQGVHPTPPLALSCECGSLYGVHEEFCPKYKSAGG